MKKIILTLISFLFLSLFCANAQNYISFNKNELIKELSNNQDIKDVKDYTYYVVAIWKGSNPPIMRYDIEKNYCTAYSVTYHKKQLPMVFQELNNCYKHAGQNKWIGSFKKDDTLVYFNIFLKEKSKRHFYVIFEEEKPSNQTYLTSNQ